LGTEAAPNGTTTTAPVNGETPSGEEVRNETFTRADLDAALEKVTAKFNGELASLRKKLANQQPRSPSDMTKPEGEDKARSTTVTMKDIAVIRELGKLEAKLGEDVVDELRAENPEFEELTLQQQLIVLRAAAKVRGEKPKAEDDTSEDESSGDEAETQSRGEKPVKKRQNPRAQPATPRDTPLRPKTKREYLELRKKSPDAANKLLKDETFDPNALPW
jgi:hypothetical protein